MLALAIRCEDLAKRWVIALIRDRPLAELDDLQLEDLVREAPELCAGIARALESDVELERLVSGELRGRDRLAPLRSLAAFAGTQDAQAVVGALDALRGVIWHAALVEVPDASARLVADLADRLGLVCSRILAAALEQAETETGDASTPQAHAEPPADAEHVLYRARALSPQRPDAVLIDEAPSIAPADTNAAVSPAKLARAREGTTQRTTPRPRPWDPPQSSPGRSAGGIDRGGSAGRASVEEPPRARRGGSPGSAEEPIVRITRRPPPLSEDAF